MKAYTYVKPGFAARKVSTPIVKMKVDGFSGI